METYLDKLDDDSIHIGWAYERTRIEIYIGENHEKSGWTFADTQNNILKYGNLLNIECRFLIDEIDKQINSKKYSLFLLKNEQDNSITIEWAGNKKRVSIFIDMIISESSWCFIDITDKNNWILKNGLFSDLDSLFLTEKIKEIEGKLKGGE
jgi:hypothetical protein